MAMLGFLRPKVPLYLRHISTAKQDKGRHYARLYLRHISTAKQDKTTSEHEQLDFGNMKEAYRSKTFSELMRNLKHTLRGRAMGVTSP